MNSRAMAGAFRNKGMLRNPGVRAGLVAGAALAGWHGGARMGWWRHGNGGYGWVGPLFWPFAYYDIYDYALWGNRYYAPFWGYGYPDIYAGLFAPYGYDELVGYMPPRNMPVSGRRAPPPDRLAQMCGDDSRDIAGLPIEQIQQSVDLNDAQRVALDDLQRASAAASDNIRAACPTTISLTAPSRLAFMQQRIEAMIGGVATVQPPLEKFYGLLDDEQKLRLNALGDDQRRRATSSRRRGTAPTASLGDSCSSAQSVALEWPADEIETRLRPTDDQRAKLVALQDSSARAADMLKSSCQPDVAATPPARLTAVSKRLDTMLQAVKGVRAALDAFYATLSDEQKAQFEAIGPRRTVLSGQPQSTQGQVRY